MTRCQAPVKEVSVWQKYHKGTVGVPAAAGRRNAEQTPEQECWTSNTTEHDYRECRKEKTCLNCKQPGHLIRDCKERSSGIRTEVQRCSEKTTVDTNLLIDSGGSEHMVNDVNCFETLEETEPVHFTFANGHSAVATQKGEVTTEHRMGRR
ncbi:hypothetical protein NDN08_006620 [Rhodosorus marinus]|uniref:CCHC-type domain-containing protein n=1 Tax=Rhodosorus marinus TaxID=101924 RepID=A0AAV8UM29_9RHOD|nr:hypothetical protein NDN08_006620 [Rhodosorus marinus]